LPERCIINGFVNNHISPFDQCQYQNVFQVQLPLPANWNGRFMFQGGGGTEGSVPAATGTIGGTTGITEISNGYAVASQNGGHLDSDLAACASTNPSTFGNNNQFFLDPLDPHPCLPIDRRGDHADREVPDQPARRRWAKPPYWVGCSNGAARHGDVAEIPSFFDGTLAAIRLTNTSSYLSEINGAGDPRRPPVEPRAHAPAHHDSAGRAGAARTASLSRVHLVIRGSSRRLRGKRMR
jgi:feruloyl esterase